MLRILLFCSLSLCVGAISSAYVFYQLGASKLPPLPAAASVELQSAIENTAFRSVAAIKLMKPQTDEQWQKLLGVLSSQAPVSLEGLSSQFGVSISKEKIAGVPVYRVKPDDLGTSNALFVYVHGGAYVYGGGDRAAREAAVIAFYSGIETIAIDYRMPPEFPQPAAIDDVGLVYRHLLDQNPSRKIGLGGTSAGGGLSMAAIHSFKAKQWPLPAALYLGTPWADVTKSSDTLYTNEGIDRVLNTYDGVIESAAALYANGLDLKDPSLSPIYGSFEDFPPTYLLSGTRDLLLSDTVRTHRKLREANIQAELNVYEGLSHAEYVKELDTPESVQAYKELAVFLQRYLASKVTGS